MSNIVIYARKSTESEDRQVLSIDSQIDELKQFAHRESLNVAKVFIESKSAKKPGRPVFNSMLKELRKLRAVGVLCWKLDRLARNPLDGWKLIDAVETGLIQEIRTPSQLYRNTSNDKFMMQLDFSIAKKYVDDLSDNVKRGLKAKVTRGWYPSTAPIGYLNDKYHEKGERRITKDPQRFPLVRKMWDLLFSRNYSVQEIHRIASEEWGLRSRHVGETGEKPIALSNAYRIFNDPFYCGLFRYKGELYKGSHDQMVTPEEFERAQAILGRPGRPRPQRHSFAFTGLFRCGECGAVITAEEHQKMVKATNQIQRYVYYRCTKRKNPKCSQRPIREEKLRSQILDWLSGFSIPKEYLDWIEAHVDEFKEKDKQAQQSRGESVRRQLDLVNRQLDNLLSLRISPQNADGSLLSDTEYALRKNKLVIEKACLEQELEGDTGHERVVVLTRQSFKLAAYARWWFAEGDRERQRQILTALGLNYVLKDGKVLIQAEKPFAFVQNTVSEMRKGNGRFEPMVLRPEKRKRAADSAPFPILYALVEDVRTFFQEHSANEGETPLFLQSLPEVPQSQ